jgi:hypothetical protein
MSVVIFQDYSSKSFNGYIYECNIRGLPYFVDDDIKALKRLN